MTTWRTGWKLPLHPMMADAVFPLCSRKTTDCGGCPRSPLRYIKGGCFFGLRSNSTPARKSGHTRPTNVRRQGANALVSGFVRWHGILQERCRLSCRKVGNIDPAHRPKGPVRITHRSRRRYNTIAPKSWAAGASLRAQRPVAARQMARSGLLTGAVAFAC